MENEKEEICSAETTEQVSEQGEAVKVKKPLPKWTKWIWLGVACLVLAGIIAWCAYSATQSKGVEGVIGLSTVVALLFGIFFIAAIGYLLGRITIKGIADVPVFKAFYIEGSSSTLYKYYGKIVQNVGLVLFVASVGFIAGPNFFKNLKKNAKSYVLLGLLIILTGALLSVAFAAILGEEYSGKEFSVGILSGSLTTTPGYSAALEACADEAGKSMVTLGHAIAYPFGVVGVVLFVQLIPKITKADMAKERELLHIGATEKKEKKAGLFTADPFGLMPFALAVVCGLLFGAIKIPLTSKGYDGTCFSLGTTGGVLIMCLIFGHFGHMGKLSLEIPEKTAKVFREFGLMLFLIGAGVAGGAQLVTKIAEYGGMIILYGFLGGIIMTILPMIVGFFFAKYVLKISLLNNLGSITGGMTSTPALGTLISTAGTDDVASAYASTYPIALVAVVLCSQFIITLM